MKRQRKRNDDKEEAPWHQTGSAAPEGLKNWDEIPSWQQDNEYILSGYRVPTGSFFRSFQSLVYVHNETVNIYSHLFGAAFFLIEPIYLYETFQANYLRATRGDVIVFSTFFYGVAICFLLSST